MKLLPKLNLDYLICDIAAPKLRVLLIFFTVVTFRRRKIMCEPEKPGIVARSIPHDEITPSVCYQRICVIA